MWALCLIMHVDRPICCCSIVTCKIPCWMNVEVQAPAASCKSTMTPSLSLQLQQRSWSLAWSCSVKYCTRMYFNQMVTWSHYFRLQNSSGAYPVLMWWIELSLFFLSIENLAITPFLSKYRQEGTWTFVHAFLSIFCQSSGTKPD